MRRDGQNRRFPRHVAFICDGNSRWARARNLPVATGHKQGADRLVRVLDALRSNHTGVVYCTMYGFSTENWNRPRSEVQRLFSIMEAMARQLQHRCQEDRVRVRILGDLSDSRIPSSLRKVLLELERDTAERMQQHPPETVLTLSLAINYGGRQDILHACEKLAAHMASSANTTTVVTEEMFASHLSTAGIPDPDLVIRTSGECRLSGFLLWNLAYAELYFTDALWPDFDDAALQEALDWYAARTRRFGGRSSLSQPEQERTSS